VGKAEIVLFVRMQFFYGEAIVTKMGVLLDEHEEGKSEFW
jgi:hypothetical protein